MTRVLAGVALAGAVLAAPLVAQAPETEFGVDVVVKAVKSAGGGSAVLEFQTPVDLRVAFHGAGSFALEPRLTALFVAGNGGHAYTLDPGLNVLVGVPGGTQRSGAYFTAGADIVLVGSSGTTGRSYYSVNTGVGLRQPMGAHSASRAEVYIGLTPKQGTTVYDTIFTIGLRLGLSFFD